MSERLRGIIVSHGSVAPALLDAVRCITGDTNGLVVVSNEGCGLATLRERIEAAKGSGPAIVFVDLPGGSCFMAAAKLQRECSDMAVVAGVNLPMLIEFVQHPLDDTTDAVRRAVKTGAKSIRALPT